MIFQDQLKDKLKKASAYAEAQFIFEELICCYGSIAEIVTDMGIKGD